MEPNTTPIPHYINNPIINAATAPELKLVRPKISYGKAVLYVFSHVIASGVLSLLLFYIKEHSLPSSLPELCPVFWITLVILFAITMRFSCIWFVRLYQRYAQSDVRLRCCMTPSCSEYAVLAFKKHGAVIGVIKTYKRLRRCHPPGYIDYP